MNRFKIYVLDSRQGRGVFRRRSQRILLDDTSERKYATVLITSCCWLRGDVTFEQSFRPSGSIEGGRWFFSGKHKLHGYKVEVLLLPNGLAIGTSEHFSELVSDFEIIQRRLQWHKDKIMREERQIDNTGYVSSFWTLLWIMGSTGGKELSKNPRDVAGNSSQEEAHKWSFLSTDIASNEDVLSDRIIVENYFGRLSGLWTLLGTKWRWSEYICDSF